MLLAQSREIRNQPTPRALRWSQNPRGSASAPMPLSCASEKPLENERGNPWICCIFESRIFFRYQKLESRGFFRRLDLLCDFVGVHLYRLGGMSGWIDANSRGERIGTRDFDDLLPPPPRPPTWAGGWFTLDGEGWGSGGSGGGVHGREIEHLKGFGSRERGFGSPPQRDPPSLPGSPPSSQRHGHNSSPSSPRSHMSNKRPLRGSYPRPPITVSPCPRHQRMRMPPDMLAVMVAELDGTERQPHKCADVHGRDSRCVHCGHAPRRRRNGTRPLPLRDALPLWLPAVSMSPTGHFLFPS